MASLKFWQTRASEHLLNLGFPFRKAHKQAGRFWAHTVLCLPYSLNDTNHSDSTHDNISSGIICGGCSLQTLQFLPLLSRLETAGAGTRVTQGFSYWLNGMPVHSTCCLIVLIVFVSPPKANTKNVPCLIVWISDQWKGTCFAAALRNSLVLIMTLELFPLLFPHMTYMILLPYIKTTHYKDIVAEVRLYPLPCFALCLEFILHRRSFGDFTSIYFSSISHPGQWRSRNTERLGLSLQKTQAAGRVRVLRLITLLLEGSARSCLDRPRPAGD